MRNESLKLIVGQKISSPFHRSVLIIIPTTIEESSERSSIELTHGEVEVIFVSRRLQSDQRREWRALHRIPEVITRSIECSVLLVEAHVFTDDNTPVLTTARQAGYECHLGWTQQLLVSFICVENITPIVIYRDNTVHKSWTKWVFLCILKTDLTYLCLSVYMALKTSVFVYICICIWVWR